MKKFFFVCFIMICFSQAVSAQGERIFLFDNFGTGLVKFKSGAKSVYPMNYDANNGKMYFMQGQELMELVGVSQVDSIAFGTRKFVQKNNDFVEILQLQHGAVGIKWRIKKIHEGYVGAMGVTTQAGAKKIQLKGNFGLEGLAGAGGGMYNGTTDVNQNEGRSDRMDVWKQKNVNTYYFTKNGIEYAVNSLKKIYKMFPEQKQDISTFVKEHELDMTTADNAILIIDYILSL